MCLEIVLHVYIACRYKWNKILSTHTKKNPEGSAATNGSEDSSLHSKEKRDARSSSVGVKVRISGGGVATWTTWYPATRISGSKRISVLSLFVINGISKKNYKQNF